MSQHDPRPEDLGATSPSQDAGPRRNKDAPSEPAYRVELRDLSPPAPEPGTRRYYEF